MIEPRIEPHDALARLADWGFIATSDLPDKPGPASLLIALRERPTLAHYDPERVEFWATRGERGVHVTVTRETPMPIDAVFSWGLIRIADRLGETNEYAAFGGHVAAELVDGVVVVVFTSPAPILRRGGHTQGWDPGATSIVAFFSRLLVAVDFGRGSRRRSPTLNRWRATPRSCRTSWPAIASRPRCGKVSPTCGGSSRPTPNGSSGTIPTSGRQAPSSSRPPTSPLVTRPA